MIINQVENRAPQIHADRKTYSNKNRGNNCGKCKPCLRDDCGKCRFCKDKKWRGGFGTLRKGCTKKKCVNPILDPKSMKKKELRVELKARGLNTKGLKSQLAARLQVVFDEEN